MKEDNNDKQQYIMKFMVDSKYYFQKNKIKQLNEILNYYKAFLFESKKEDIMKIKDILLNNKEGYEKYLSDYDMAQRMNVRLPIIKFLINSKQLDDIKNENEVKQNIEIWTSLEKMIKSNKVKEIQKDTKIILEKYFKDDKNKPILLQIFTQDELDKFINCFNSINIKEYSYEDIISILNDKNKTTSFRNFDVDYSISSKIDIYEPKNGIEFIRIMEEHKNSADFIIELKNGLYLSGGRDNILKIYDKNYVRIKTIEDFKDLEESIYKIGEKMDSNEKNENIIKLLVPLKQELDILYLDKTKSETFINRYKIPNNRNFNFIEMKNNEIIFVGGGGCSYFIDLFKKPLTEHKITEKAYTGAIRINDKIAVLTSNKDILNGENKLIFYHIMYKKIVYEINGYFFFEGANNLMLMELKKDFKILICACKKNTEPPKNGILLINPQLEHNRQFRDPFYEIVNFEVFCFCQIINTNCILLGGYDVNETKGKIKLFKVESDFKYYLEIIFINDIECLDINESISCIIQSKDTGHILVTCYNGKVYLLTPPNIDYYLNNQEKKIRKKIFFK